MNAETYASVLGRFEGLSMTRIAELLGASQVISIIPSRRRKHGPITTFDVPKLAAWLSSQPTAIQLPEEYEQTEQVIFPTGAGELIVGTGEGIQPKQVILRTRFLIDYLSEQKIPYIIKDGINEPTMFRTLSYQFFLLPTLSKMVAVNNEEGNRSYVFHDSLDWQKYREWSKEKLNELPPQICGGIIFPGTREKFLIRIRYLLEYLAPKGQPVNRDEAPIAEAELAREIGSSVGFVRENAERLAAGNAAWIIRTTYGARESRSYAAPLAQMLRELFESYGPLAREGECTAGMIAEEFNTGRPAVETIAEPYRKSNPEWFLKRRSPGERQHPGEFFAIPLVEIIKDFLKNTPARLQANDLTVSKVGRKYKIGASTVEAFIERFRELPGGPYTLTRSIGAFQTAEIPSPTLIAALEKWLSRLPGPPLPGELTMTLVVEKLGSNKNNIRPESDRYRASHPHWFVRRKREGDQVREFFTPPLIRRLELFWKRAKALEPVDGEQSTAKVAKSLNRNINIIRHWVKHILRTHPDWAREGAANGKATQLCKPPLIAELSRYNQEAGEFPFAHLTGELGYEPCDIRTAVDLVREENPQWFRSTPINNLAQVAVRAILGAQG